MAVKRFNLSTSPQGVNLEYQEKAASTDFSGKGLVTDDADGNLVPASATDSYVKGIGIQKVTSNDEDYADNSMKAYDEAREGDRFIIDIDDDTGVDIGDELTLADAETATNASLTAGQFALLVVKKVLGDNQIVATLKRHEPTDSA